MGTRTFTLRIVQFQDLKGHLYLLATNLFTLPATDIADLYHERWAGGNPLPLRQAVRRRSPHDPQ